MFIDSHCHLNGETFATDLDDVLKRAQDAGVHQCMTICTSLEEADEVLTLATSRQLFCSIGVHPHEADKVENLSTLPDTLNHYGQHASVKALGETGLDYYYEHSLRDLQKEAFRAHIAVAQELDLPLIVHTRDAEKDTIAILKENRGQVRGVIHCFSGTQALADAALDLGFYISFSGILTFKKADDLREIAKTVPLNRMLIETDAPYLAPVPYRGKRNEPSFVVKVAETLAEIKGLTVEEIGKITTQNYEELFLKSR